MSPATAREHAEGILRGLERFPKARLDGVGTFTSDEPTYARAALGRIEFNLRYSSAKGRAAYVRSLQRDAADGWHPGGTGTPFGVAMHDFAHVLEHDVPADFGPRLEKLLKTEAKKAGTSVDQLVERRISKYAATDRHELLAEALADTIINGDNASKLSRSIVELLEPQRVSPAVVAKAIKVGDFSILRRIGPQTGSNPGGLYEAPDGSRWYVKAQKSQQHADNEVLASRLYRAAGIDVPEVVTGAGTPELAGGFHTATRLVPDARSDLGQRLADTAYLDRLREGFAVDAWLANWDVAGATFDNIVTTLDGRPIRIDLGGSLLFRAGGSAKGSAFGPKVGEWLSLRDPTLAPNASRLFGGMTRDQVQAAALKVKQITPAKIRKLVADAGLPPELADILIARRKHVLDLAKKEPARGPDRSFEARLASALAEQAALDSVPITVKKGHIAPAPAGWTKTELGAAGRAVQDYQGDGYTRINSHLRTGRGGTATTAAQADAIARLMRESALPSDALVWRGIREPTKVFGSAWNPNPAGSMVGVTWTERGYLSTSADERVAREGFTGSSQAVLFRIVLPSGIHGIRLSDMAPPGVLHYTIQNEAEILATSGLKLRVVADHGVVRGARRLDVEVV